MYSPRDIESKWQKFWLENKTFAAKNPPFVGEAPKKAYVLDMFPYPSGAGLHVGHPKGYVATDVLSRFLRANNFNVLHPMGWDAFGLPAENYAIKTGTHPAVTTAQNIATFKRQIQSLGLSYDWDREIDTTDPEYYRWTQWIFLKLFERGLAYEQDLPINYCPNCKTGLANEEVLADNTCDRCGTLVERRKLRQWVLKITDYAERLLADVDGLQWPEGIKEMQRNWIGKSEGVEFSLRRAIDREVINTQEISDACIRSLADFVVNGVNDGTNTEAREHYEIRWEILQDLMRTHSKEEYSNLYAQVVTAEINAFVDAKWDKATAIQMLRQHFGLTISVYTTRVDTVYGMGWVVIAPDHASVSEYITPEQAAACQAYIDASKSKSDQDRQNDGKEKTGVFTGSYVINPFNGEQIPVWIGDYVLGSYGTGAVMGVAAHDERDYDFAKKYNLPITKVIVSAEENARYDTLDAQLTDSEDPSMDAILEEMDQIEDVLAGDVAYCQEGYLIKGSGENDELLDRVLGLDSKSARAVFAQYAQEKGFGSKKTNYKLRDWLFSRQRYWGEPIPLIHLATEDVKKLPHISDLSEATDVSLAYILKRDPLPDEKLSQDVYCGDKVRVLVIDGKEFSKIHDGLYTKIICDYRLPLELPSVERYEPAGDGNSPLATVDSFVQVQVASNLAGRRETNTMPQWGGSCWYYLRFMDPKNTEALVGKEVAEYWGSVDQYVGGAEHAVLHLLYARFWHKVLFDIGVVSNDEPFAKLLSPGLILGPDGNKMSKSKGNVVNPDREVEKYGTDTFRVFMLGLSDFRDPSPWNIDAIAGAERLLERIHASFTESPKAAADDMKAMKLLNKTIKKVGEDIPAFKFNTAITALNILMNEGIPVDAEFRTEWQEAYLKLLHPFAPHIAEELWNKLGYTGSIQHAPWPEYDEFMLIDDDVTIAIQVNGKLRATFEFLNGVAQEEVAATAYASEEIKKWTEGKTIVREIFVPNKLFSIVVKDA